MKTDIQASFSVQSWDESTWEGADARATSGRKQSHARVTYAYDGDLKGESELHYLMSYNEDGTGTFVGMERFSGSVRGKEGGFVLSHTGTFDSEAVRGELTVAPGSGTGELAGISGAATVSIAGHKASYPITFALELPA